MKRVFDFIMSIIAIIVLLPVILVVAILVKTTSKGPILFKQRRIGKDNVEFNIYKFRTMRCDTPNVATHLLNNTDSFYTPIGKGLRKLSLDELPQLFNILKGEMSIVGPRPALYSQYDLKEARSSKGIHKLVPGLSGWAQVNGRDTITLETKVKFDKEYLDKQSFIFDLKIIWLTIYRVVKTEGVTDGVIEKDVIEKKITVTSGEASNITEL
ncbi:sugar transferase [Clostridium gasigenes]|uniref:O-antigen biosynthesis protein WbqP n=1 Tax=Clostridium gasigenes TaxID=94869 RepID=A0A1H0TGH2_9CLOT|nr:sugar transferase [Clostridium gasigenes]MBU3090140.1 sugar transferase [Clostridium gasigenes]SDP52760.1 O-antigen biosynthesis protein WbqP [Clostridium gasigenes]